jgi:S1-C subfamily serine protease
MGDAVFTIGFPNTQLQGVRPKYTNGRISSLSGLRDDPRKVQVTVPIQPGNSGGPLVDERGNVVGVVSSSLRDRPDEVRQLVNYAVKSSFALAFLESLTDVVELLPRPIPNQATGSENPIRRVNNATVRIRVERSR